MMTTVHFYPSELYGIAHYLPDDRREATNDESDESTSADLWLWLYSQRYGRRELSEAANLALGAPGVRRLDRLLDGLDDDDKPMLDRLLDGLDDDDKPMRHSLKKMLEFQADLPPRKDRLDDA